jgi:hypothetical protein
MIGQREVHSESNSVLDWAFDGLAAERDRLVSEQRRKYPGSAYSLGRGFSLRSALGPAARLGQSKAN